MTTIITALFDINREYNGDGRSIDQYLLWFKDTLKLNAPMVIYTEDKFVSFINENRDESNTIVIIQKLEEIPYFKYNSRIDEVIKSDVYKSKIRDPNRVECVLSLYNVIQYSKFGWMCDVIENGYLESDYYFWMDAGCSRFFNGVDSNKIWPDKYISLDIKKLNIQGNYNTNTYNYIGEESYIWDSNCLLVGTLFGGGSKIITKISKLVEELFVSNLNLGKVNNEQILLAILMKKYPELFNIYIELNGNHLPFFKKISHNGK